MKLLIKLCGLIASSLWVLGMWSFAHAEVQWNEMPTVPKQQMTRAYQADYILTRRGSRHGVATRELKALDNGIWEYSTSTEASLFLLSDRRHQVTHFRLDKSEYVLPLDFTYERTGTGRNQRLSVSFDYELQSFVPREKSTVEARWVDGILDSNAVLHQLQIDLSHKQDELVYALINEKGENQEYQFQVIGKELLHLPYGVVDSIKIKRVRDNNKRETFFWFAPSLGYVMVKMQQLEKGKEQLQLSLSKLELAKRTLDYDAIEQLFKAQQNNNE